MRNEPSILFSMKQTMFFVLKEQLGALKFVERSQETFCGYVPFYTFIVFLFTNTQDGLDITSSRFSGIEIDQLI